MNQLKISVVTPSYNQGKFLQETIDSVLKQNYAYLEYIIIDGGSIDQSAEIIKKYERSLAYWESVKDKGQSDAINKGLKRATGDILAFLNSDDLYCPGTFEFVNSFFISNPGVDILVGKTRFVDEKTDPAKGFAELFEKPINDESIYTGCHIPQPSVFWRKKVSDKVGLFNQELNYCFDYEYWVRIYSEGFVFSKTEKELSLFRLQESSKTLTAYGTGKFDEEFLTIFRTYYTKVKNSQAKGLLVHSYSVFLRLFFLHVEKAFGVHVAKKKAFKKITDFPVSLTNTLTLKLILWLTIPSFIRKGYVKSKTI